MAKQVLLTCHCLNVQLHQKDYEELQPNELEYFDLLIGSLNEHSRKEIDNFLINSKLIKLSSKGIKINYQYLCLKKIVDDLQITFCAVCEKETHAIFISKSNHNNNNKTQLVLAHSFLLNDENKIADLRSSHNYSQALRIVLPDRLIYSNMNESKSNSGIGKTFNYDNNSYLLTPNYIQMDVSDKIKNFLQQERTYMQERIKLFTNEQEKNFRDLYQTTQDNKNSFLRMIETIKSRHNIDNDFFDKENQQSELNSIKNNNFDIDRFSNHNSQVQKISIDDLSLTTKNSEEFDCLFDIDDIDVNHALSKHSNKGIIEKEEEIPDDFDLEEQDVFPLKESNTFSQVLNNVLIDESFPLSALPSDRQRKLFSIAQNNKSNYYGNKNDHVYTHQVANSLPIQIPHFTHKTDREMEETFRINPGESIADSIQKLARSVRNENDILDDRPRRRLNTGDLIKSRPFFN